MRLKPHQLTLPEEENHVVTSTITVPKCNSFIATFFFLFITLLATQALAQDEYRELDLPQQSLQESLVSVGKTYGVTIVAPSDILRDKIAPPVSGRLSIEQAINQLLQDSGLERQHSSNGSILLKKKVILTNTETSSSSKASDKNEEQGLQLAPVIVTGERSERTLYETAASTAVVSGEDIEKTPSFKEVDDILQTIPNVDLGGNSNEGPTIRGVKAGGPLSGVYAFFGGSRPRATITVDGRSVSFDEFIFGATSVWDVQRVEVFRGPQTTSQGVNSIAGAIHVVTSDPTYEPHFKAQAEYGDYKSGRISASASGPLVEDQLAILLSADLQRSDSFIDIQPTSDYGPDPNTFLNGVIRGKVLWEPTSLPELRMKFTLESTRNEAPQAEYVKTTGSIKDLKSISTNLPSRRLIATTGIHDVSYEFSDSIKLSNRFSYSDIDSNRYVDLPTSGKAKSEKDEVSNETTLHWENQESGLSGLMGVFYQHTNSDEYLNYSLAGEGTFDDLQTSLGLYTEVNYDITDRLDLTMGVRYEQDRQDRSGATVGGSLYNIDMEYDKTFESILPKISIGYDVSDNVRIGALVSRGFNPGGVTLLWSDGSTNYFDEETVWNYEIFSRIKLLENRLVLNTNIFYADYSDYQLNYLAGDFYGSAVYGIANAEEAVSYGLELSADYLPTEKLHIYSGLGLLQTEIKKFDDAGGIDAEGASFMRSPSITLSLGADYELIKNLTIGGRARYVGEYKSEDTNDSLSAGDYAVVDLQASYDYDPFTVYGYVNNVFDSFYTISELTVGRAIVGNPRKFGVGIKYSF